MKKTNHGGKNKNTANRNIFILKNNMKYVRKNNGARYY